MRLISEIHDELTFDTSDVPDIDNGLWMTFMEFFDWQKLDPATRKPWMDHIESKWAEWKAAANVVS